MVADEDGTDVPGGPDAPAGRPRGMDGPTGWPRGTDGPDPVADGPPPASADERGLPADERGLLDGFARKAPQGSLNWNFEDALRRVSDPEARSGWIVPWTGLPSDLWERGRGTRAAERVMSDVITQVAQEVTEYAQRIALDVGRSVADAPAVHDALQFLARRVEVLERAADPLGLRPAELDLPTADTAEWADVVPTWLPGGHRLPVVVGELDDLSILGALARAGGPVEGVDPRGVPVWAADEALSGSARKVSVVLAPVLDHLRGVPAGSRHGIVLSGCIDRVSLATKVELVDTALRALAPGGTLVVIVTDQSAWDDALAPPVRDLLPGRPLHPETWSVLLAHRGLTGPVRHRSAGGRSHALVGTVGP